MTVLSWSAVAVLRSSGSVWSAADAPVNGSTERVVSLMLQLNESARTETSIIVAIIHCLDKFIARPLGLMTYIGNDR